MLNRTVLIVLIFLLLVLQSKLWLGKGGVREIHQLQNAIEEQTVSKQQLSERNDALKGEVLDLKSGLDAIEERARNEMGMIKKGEIFYHIVEQSSHSGSDDNDED